jgi:hypothetical protein
MPVGQDEEDDSDAEQEEDNAAGNSPKGKNSPQIRKF